MPTTFHITMKLKVTFICKYYIFHICIFIFLSTFISFSDMIVIELRNGSRNREIESHIFHSCKSGLYGNLEFFSYWSNAWVFIFVNHISYSILYMITLHFRSTWSFKVRNISIILPFWNNFWYSRLRNTEEICSLSLGFAALQIPNYSPPLIDWDIPILRRNVLFFSFHFCKNISLFYLNFACF